MKLSSVSSTLFYVGGKAKVDSPVEVLVWTEVVAGAVTSANCRADDRSDGLTMLGVLSAVRSRGQFSTLSLA